MISVLICRVNYNLDTVEPYWTTNYHFKDVFRDIVCPIFRRDLPFERWLGLWCRGLSHKVSYVAVSCIAAISVFELLDLFPTTIFSYIHDFLVESNSYFFLDIYYFVAQAPSGPFAPLFQACRGECNAYIYSKCEVFFSHFAPVVFSFQERCVRGLNLVSYYYLSLWLKF
jgi:hypothetical protein